MSIISATSFPKKKKKKNSLFGQLSWGTVKSHNGLSLRGDIDMQVAKLVLSEQNDGNPTDNSETNPKRYSIGIKESVNDVCDEWGLTLQEMNELTALGAELVPSYRNEANEENLWQSYVIVNSEEQGQKIWDDWFTPRLIANIMCKPTENF